MQYLDDCRTASEVRQNAIKRDTWRRAQMRGESFLKPCIRKTDNGYSSFGALADYVQWRDKQTISIVLHGAPAKAADIIDFVCKLMGVSRDELNSPDRHVHYVKARHVACWALRQFTNLSLQQISYRIGGRDHTTAINSIRRVADDINGGGELCGYAMQVAERFHRG